MEDTATIKKRRPKTVTKRKAAPRASVDDQWVIPMLENMRKYPAIWDLRSADHRIANARDNAWKKLSEEVAIICGQAIESKIVKYAKRNIYWIIL